MLAELTCGNGVIDGGLRIVHCSDPQQGRCLPCSAFESAWASSSEIAAVVALKIVTPCDQSSGSHRKGEVTGIVRKNRSGNSISMLPSSNAAAFFKLRGRLPSFVATVPARQSSPGAASLDGPLLGCGAGRPFFVWCLKMVQLGHLLSAVAHARNQSIAMPLQVQMFAICRREAPDRKKVPGVAFQHELVAVSGGTAAGASAVDHELDGCKAGMIIAHVEGSSTAASLLRLRTAQET